MIGIPRLQGRAYQLKNKKWSWEVFVTILGGDRSDRYGPKDGAEFKTKKDALAALSKAVQHMSDAICEVVPGAVKGKMLNLKTNQLIPTDKI